MSCSQLGCLRVRAVAFALAVMLLTTSALAQSVSNVTQRPFVTGIIPVIGRGGFVGGVAINAKGVVDRSSVKDSRLKKEVAEALKSRDANLNRPSRLRKVSLRSIEAALQDHQKRKQPMPAELACLGGLQEIRYVFVDEDRKDIVLAGFAEGWKPNEEGELVGVTTGMPVLHLEDLLVAFRSAEQAAERGVGCSIDPTEKGLQAVERALRSGLTASPRTVKRLERTMGPQQISVFGVEPTTHFARVLVAADFRMKLWGMNLERAPVADMPSYMELLQADNGPPPRNAMPRWWMAPKYDAILHDDDGLAWKLEGSGAQVLTEDGFLAKNGKLVNAGTTSPLAKKWADTMTDKFAALARETPIMAELRNCIDLSVVAAIILRKNLILKADYEFEYLFDSPEIRVPSYPVPKTVASRASLVRRGKDWIVSVSGGVEINAWKQLDNTKLSAELAQTRAKAVAGGGARWWWDK